MSAVSFMCVRCSKYKEADKNKGKRNTRGVHDRIIDRCLYIYICTPNAYTVYRHTVKSAAAYLYIMTADNIHGRESGVV